MRTLVEYRRDDLDRSLHALRAVLMAAGSRHPVLTSDRPFPLTSSWAREHVTAAEACVACTKGFADTSQGPATMLAIGIVSVLSSHAEFVSKDADALDRAIRAAESSDDASAAADGASLVGGA